MASDPTPKVENYEGTRITVHSSHPFDDVLSRLHSSIGSTETENGRQIIASLTHPTSPQTAQTFSEAVKSAVGPHDFMVFHELDHSTWPHLFNVHTGLKARRVLVGNPLVAITMMKHDMTAGLAVPVELLLLEKEEGGTDVVYQLPSALIARINTKPELVKAATDLDAKLAVLVQFVAA